MYTTSYHTLPLSVNTLIQYSLIIPIYPLYHPIYNYYTLYINTSHNNTPLYHIHSYHTIPITQFVYIQLSTYTPLHIYNHYMRSVWITSTTDTINSICVILSQCLFFSQVILYLCNCVYIICCACCYNVLCGTIYRIFFCFDGLIIQSTHIVHHTHHIVKFFHPSTLFLIYLR